MPTRPVFAPRWQLADGGFEGPTLQQQRHRDAAPNYTPAQIELPLEEIAPLEQELRIVPQIPEPEAVSRRNQTNEVIPVGK